LFYKVFSLLCESRLMDLGFARRPRKQARIVSSVQSLGQLLSCAAARQSLSPTARAQSLIDARSDYATAQVPQAALFEGGRDVSSHADIPASFSVNAASLITSQQGT
jgi:hypothetical protein